MTQPRKLDRYVSSNSFINNDLEGSQQLKLSSNPVAIASRRLQFRKRTWNDEHVASHENAEVHMSPHMVGVSNTTGASNPPIVVVQLGANIAPGTNIILGANGSSCATATQLPVSASPTLRMVVSWSLHFKE
jgi:hypothetical protein